MFGRIRAAADELSVPVGVLADLAGPKIRVGCFAGGSVDLVEGSTVTLQPSGAPDRPSAIAIRNRTFITWSTSVFRN